MKMITEDYVSFETAKLLKEKGFDDICDKVYREHDSYLCPIEYCMNLKGEGYYLAPTLQMAMKWLREEHKLHCDVSYDTVLGWYFQIKSLTETEEYYDYPETKIWHPDDGGAGYDTYEEAAELAIKYCLENLI